MGTPTVSVTPAPVAITDLAGTLVAGGSLTIGQVYYYVAVAIRNDTSATTLTGKECAYGGISNEVGPFTITSGNQQVDLTWTLPANATGVVILRRKAADTYNTSNDTRIRGTGNSANLSTVGAVGAYSDDASRTLYYPTVLSVLPATQLLPCGFDPRMNGSIACEFYGTSLDLEDIYTALVGTYPNYVYWDGNTFGFLGNLYTHASNQVTLSDAARVAYFFGTYYNNNSHASTLITWGALNYGKPINSMRFFIINGILNPAANFINELHYGTIFHLGRMTGYDNNILAGGNLGFSTGCTLLNVNITGNVDGTFISIPDSVFVDGLINYDDRLSLSETNGIMLLQQRCQAPYFYALYTNNTRWILDRFSLTKSEWIIDYYDTTDLGCWLIDCKWPNIVRSDGLPEVNWRATVPITTLVVCASTCILRTVDAAGNPVSSLFSLKDNADAALVDYWGAAVTNLANDANGYFWKVPITVGAGPSTTTIPGGTGWTVDAYKGMHFYLYKNNRLYGPVKVKSNTSTTLTLCEALPFTPAEGDLGGIALWVPWGYLNHKNGTGLGYGATYTDYTLYNPLTIAITATGYQDYQRVITIDEAMDLEVALLAAGGGGSGNRFTAIPSCKPITISS